MASEKSCKVNYPNRYSLSQELERQAEDPQFDLKLHLIWKLNLYPVGENKIKFIMFLYTVPKDDSFRSWFLGFEGSLWPIC